MWEISFNGRVRGPIHDGRMRRWFHEYEHDVADALAQDAKDSWVHNLEGSIRHPTPYYWTRIAAREVSPTRYEVHDHGIVYGPWLEGTGSRNSPVTRFPGYHSLARAKEASKRRRGNVARKILRRYRSEGKLI